MMLEDEKVEEDPINKSAELDVTKGEGNKSAIDCESFNRELPFCKICWVNDTSYENPLLSSCKCRGGV